MWSVYNTQLKAGTFLGTAPAGNRPPKTGTVPGKRLLWDCIGRPRLRFTPTFICIWFESYYTIHSPLLFVTRFGSSFKYVAKFLPALGVQSIRTEKHGLRCFIKSTCAKWSGSVTSERDLPRRIKAILDISVLHRRPFIPAPSSAHMSRPSGVISRDCVLKIKT